MKNAAFVKMRDSVSFCKQILIEYVLRNSESKRSPLYMFLDLVCACKKSNRHVNLAGWSARIH